MHSILITTTDMSEPHWHPETDEIGYVVEGHAYIIILEPNGDNPLHKHKLKRGNVYFIPPGFPHHIKSTGKVDVVICAFYDKSMPSDIAITGSNQWPNLPFDP